ncbi:MFS transporter [Streptomyces sp. NPDC001889]
MEMAKFFKGRLWRDRNFMLFWSGESVSLLGSEVTVIVLPSLAVFVFGAGAATVGALISLQWIPYVVLGPIVGVWADRVSRRMLMIVSNMARALILGWLPVAAALDVLTIEQIYVAAVLKGSMDVVFQISYHAYIPSLIDREDLVEGNTKTEFSKSAAILFGRSLGGVLIAGFGAARAVMFDALSFVVATITLLFIDKREEPRTAAGQERGLAAVWLEMRQGFTLVTRTRLYRFLLVISTSGNFAVSMMTATLFSFVYRDLGLSARDLGLAMGVGGAAMVVGALLAQPLNNRWGMGPTLIVGHAVLGVAILILPLAALGAPLTILIVSQVLTLFPVPLFNVGLLTILQSVTPLPLMGRLNGISLPLVWGANALGAALAGVLATVFGSVVCLVLAGLLVLSTIIWIVMGSIHRIGAEVPREYEVAVPN